jgi:hypothetical protein
VRTGATHARSLVLAVVALALETIAILPPVDKAAEDNAMLHFTQHGLIFIGGVMMGIALYEALTLRR